MIILGIFLIMHGLVHLLYAGQSLRYFELRPAMTWPDGSWLMSKLLDDRITRWLAAVLLALVTLGFIAAGLGLFFRQAWWSPVAAGSSILSSLLFLLFWDGKPQALNEKGGIGILINLAILILVQILRGE
jgi:hypothetical protein